MSAMDHLSTPNNAVKPDLTIPFLCKLPYKYQQDNFKDFPAHHLKSLKARSLVSAPRDALYSLCQSWLFFGTLTEYFQLSINIEQFMEKYQDDSLRLRTDHLKTLINQWIEKQRFRDAWQRREETNWCCALLKSALHACEAIEAPGYDRTLHLVLLSVRILLCSLIINTKIIAQSGYQIATLSSLLSRLRFQHSTSSSSGKDWPLLMDHMIKNGWCYHHAISIFTKYCPTTAYYFACMAHDSKNISHNACINEDSCVAHSTGEISVRHVKADCTCQSIGIQESNLIELLEADKIPLVSCSETANGTLSLSLVTSELPNTKYIAISHVWLDGLGNLKDNTLPECQLRRLVSRLQILKAPESRMEAKVLFWMDTFCIPVGNKGDNLDELRGQLKKKAIALMTPIYAGSERVIALDSQLGILAPDRLTFVELTARLASCGWMTRAWTLQEGALATRLCFQFANGFLFAQEGQALFSDNLKIARWNDYFDEQTELLRECRDAWYLPTVGQHEADDRNNLTDREVQFVEVWNSMIGRSTTKPEDLLDILANLLDFSLWDIRKLRNDRSKMRTMLLSQEKLPMDMFCINYSVACDSLSMDGNLSWIPPRPTGVRLSPQSFANSFRIQRNGIVLNFDQGSFGFFLASSKERLETFCITSHGSDGVHSRISLQNPYDALSSNYKDLYLYLSATATSGSLHGTKHYGAAFIVESNKGRVYKLRYLCSLSFELCYDNHKAQDSMHNTESPLSVAKSRRKDIMSLPLDRKLRIRPPFRRPPNAGKWGEKVTPKRRLWYLVAFCIWIGTVILLFIPLYVNPGIIFSGAVESILPILGFLDLMVGLFAVPYIVMTRFLAPKIWLRSYLGQDSPNRWMKIFEAEEKLLRWLKAKGSFLSLSAKWRKYSRPREDRWHRSEEDIQRVETLDDRAGVRTHYAGDSSIVLDYGIEMAAQARTTTDSAACYELLDSRYIKVFQELSVALPD